MQVVHQFIFLSILLSCATKKFVFNQPTEFKSLSDISIEADKVVVVGQRYHSEMKPNSPVLVENGKRRNIHSYSFTSGKAEEYIIGITAYKDEDNSSSKLFVGEPLFLDSKSRKVKVYGKNAKAGADCDLGGFYQMSYVVNLKPETEYKLLIRNDLELDGAELFATRESDGKVLRHRRYYGTNTGKYAFRVRKVMERENLFYNEIPQISFKKKTAWEFVPKKLIEKSSEAFKSPLGGNLMQYKIDKYVFGVVESNPNLNYREGVSVPINMGVYSESIAEFKNVSLKDRLNEFFGKLNRPMESIAQGRYKQDLIKSGTKITLSNKRGVVAKYRGRNPIKDSEFLVSKVYYTESKGRGIVVIISYEDKDKNKIESFEEYILENLQLGD